MNDRAARPGHLTRVQTAFTLAATLVVLSSAPRPESAWAAAGPDLNAMLHEFNRICADLTRAREELRAGSLAEEEFAERILALFVDADSLRTSLTTLRPAARHAVGSLFAMELGLRYLVESLRENYVGIVSRTGVSFVAADRALQAAVAWRSGVGPTAPAARSVADISRP